MGANDANGGHAPNWQVAWTKRIAGIPLLGLARVNLGDRVVNQPDRIRYSDFDMGAMVDVVQFPGDPDMVGAWNPDDSLRPPARDKSAMASKTFTVPAPTTPQTVSNRKRAQLAGLGAVPEGKLDIFEGVA